MSRSRTRRGSPRAAAVPEGRVPAVSDEAVHLATGRSWPEWFELLDKARAHGLRHDAIAALLEEKHHVPEWWSQMVTASYEQARGIGAQGHAPPPDARGRGSGVENSRADG
jgi:hypothetical protein